LLREIYELSTDLKISDLGKKSMYIQTFY
jgi:hypothetical protein